MRLPAFVLALAAFALGCQKDRNRGATAPPEPAAPVIAGARVTLPASQAARFPAAAVRRQPVGVNLVVPARTVAALRSGLATGEPLVLFENADVAALYSEYQRARANYARTRTQLERLRELLARNAVAGKDVTDAETDFAQAEASVRETEGKLRQGGFDPALLARLRPGAVLAVADVPEAKIASVRVGEPATFEFSAYPGERLTGRVTTVGETVDPQTRTIRATIELGDQGGRIKPGMFARVSIAERTEEALTVPLASVVSADARTYVFVKAGPTAFERREVTLGGDDGTIAQVRQGLAPGDSVVTANAILLKGLLFGY